MKKFLKIIKQADKMCRPADLILRVSLIFSILCAVYILLFLVWKGGDTADTYFANKTAHNMLETIQALLLAAVFGCVILEDRLSR